MTHVQIAADDQAEDRGVDAEEDLELHGAGILRQLGAAAAGGLPASTKSAAPASRAARVTRGAGAEQRLAVASARRCSPAGRRTPSWQAAVG